MQTLLKTLIEQVKPRNGMAVTAKVWEQAHSYHHNLQRANFLFGHGSGIIAGLGVHAEDQPNNQRLWISPGMAVDADGNVIVVEEQDSYLMDTDQEGLIHVFIESTGEAVFNNPDSRNGGSSKEPLRVRQGYVIESALTLPPKAIELARVRLWGRNASIVNAKNSNLPKINEIDARFREEVGMSPLKTIRMAISYAGQPTGSSLPHFGLNAGHLAQSLTRMGDCRVCIDEEVPLVDQLLYLYSLVYLVEHPQSRLASEELDALQTYLQNGGIVLVESYQPNSPSDSLKDLLFKENMQLRSLSPDEQLLINPYLFAAPPSGANPQGIVQIGQNQRNGVIIHSTCQHGWFLQRRAMGGPLPSREQIRASLEWVTNLITFTAQRTQVRVETYL